MMSLQFAAVKMTVSGMPCVSMMRWCLLLSLRRPVGFVPFFPASIASTEELSTMARAMPSCP
ncbi:hypothetical protein WI89_11690 [Burkholderia ubonensis]|nr:hypothetical protein WI89_11690 [Burkholderia ubonensis]